MKRRVVFILVMLFALTGSASANDTMATLGTGGLIFIQTGTVKMLSEDLYVSPTEVRVKYEFLNEGEADERTLVAFPLPDITGSPDFMVSVPTTDTENIFGFQTLLNGEPVEAELHQYAFAQNIEYTEKLLDLGIPLAPHSEAAIAAVDALSDEQKDELFGLGLIVPLEFDSGQGWERQFYPVWTLRSTYSWEADFPVGETVTVEHSYQPSVGGTVTVTFLAAPHEGYDPATIYKQKYCMDDAFVRAVERTLPNPEERWGAPFTESWIAYVWSTGANWSGAIGKFRLTVDKGSPDNLVSFCWDGKVTKTSPTTFEMEAQDWWPPWDRELEILILNRQQSMEGNVG
jgi:hypothetical protein